VRYPDRLRLCIVPVGVAEQRAAVVGWPVAERLGGHLDIVADGEAIASILIDLVRPS
jgi:hypothetical protein